MAESWGNNAATQYNEDLVSDTENTNILKVNDVNDGNDAKIAIHTINNSTNADARALKVEGRTELDGYVEIKKDLFLSGGEGGVGNIEAIDGNPLWIGASELTGMMVLGRSGQYMRMLSNVHAAGKLTVGEGAAGEIDSGGTELSPQDLKIGNNLVTEDVIISRTGKTTHIQGSLHSDGNVDIDGTLQVDGNTTLDGNVSVNGNNLYLDSNSLYGQVFNPAGQVPGRPSLDFFINGIVVSYIDSTGHHDV